MIVMMKRFAYFMDSNCNDDGMWADGIGGSGQCKRKRKRASERVGEMEKHRLISRGNVFEWRILQHQKQVEEKPRKCAQSVAWHTYRGEVEVNIVHVHASECTQ